MNICELKRLISLKLLSLYLHLKALLMGMVDNNALVDGFENKVYKKIL
jgi:hypothetical protein